MENGRNLLRRIAPVVIVVIVLWGLASLFDSSPAIGEIRRPDVIRIQTVARLKPLEMPPAVFLHDKHTQKVLTEGKDCTVCHENGASYAFQAVAGAKNAKGMEKAFHNGCIGCHEEMSAGPQDGECRLCHVGQSAPAQSAKPVRMGDRSLHYLHVSSRAITYTGNVPNPDSLNCGVCHHVYDEQAKRLVWKPGAEEACSVCHKAEAQGSVPSLQKASHDTCVACHVKVGAEKAAASETAGEDSAARTDAKNAAAGFRRIAATPDMMLPRPAVWSPDDGPAFVFASVRLAPGQIAAPDMQQPQARRFESVAPAAPEETTPSETPAPTSQAAPKPQIKAPAKAPFAETPAPAAQAPRVRVPDATAQVPASPEIQDAARAEAILRGILRENAQREAARQARAAKEAAAIEAEIVTGPVTCAGCHSAEAQASWRKVSDPPRLMRGQPDATVLMPPAAGETKRSVADASGMDPVLFNHKAHEEVTDSCAVCHHQRISACTDCHTVEGVQEGDFVTLGDAMHKSCVGCHQQTVMSKPECAGCHGPLNRPMEIKSACTVCHQPVEGLPTTGAPDKTQLEQIAEANLAARMLEKALAPQNTLSEADAIIARMPETVRIDALENKYEASVFPHRRIFQVLRKGMEGDGLAARFHTSTLATCAACHHHSPAETLVTPPACASCHGSQADRQETDANRPSLKAAYHQQCMACHERMNITTPAATDCTGCHAARPATGTQGAKENI